MLAFRMQQAKQEAPSCPDFPEFSLAAFQAATAAPLPCPALPCVPPLFSSDVQSSLASQLTCCLLVGWPSVPCPPPPLGARAQKHPWMLFA